MSKLGFVSSAVAALVLVGGMTFAVDVLEKPEGAEALPVNIACPMSGRDLNPDATSTYQGEVIGFCCNNCKSNFDEDPAEHIDKVERLAVNVACPISGRDVNPQQTVVYEGRTIGFCCGNCKSNFEEDPSEHIDEVAYEPVNTECPFSGRDINPDAVSVYQSRVVALCCNNCKGRFDENPAEAIAEVEIDNR